MQVFAYRAVDPDGKIVDGEIAAEEQAAVYASLAQHNLTLVELREHHRRLTHLKIEKKSPDDLIEFSRNMGSLLDASIPLLQILEDLEEQAEQRSWQDLIRDVRLRISGGSTISEAFAAHQSVFSDVYLSLIQAGEESGDLSGVFTKLTEHLEWSRHLREEVRHALTYPIVVLGAVLAFIAVLTFFVFPRLGEILAVLDVSLPLPTRIVLAIGRFGTEAWPILLAIPFVLALAIDQLRRHPRGRRALDGAKLRAPLLGRLLSMVAFSRLASTLSTLLSSGVQLNRALMLTQGAVGNRVIAEALGRVGERIESGETLAEALARSGRFPRILIRMARVGEHSGDVAGMLKRCSEHYERLIPVMIRKLLSAFGPIMVVFLALTVGMAALSIFLPLIQIGDAIH